MPTYCYVDMLQSRSLGFPDSLSICMRICSLVIHVSVCVWIRPMLYEVTFSLMGRTGNDARISSPVLTRKYMDMFADRMCVCGESARVLLLPRKHLHSEPNNNENGRPRKQIGIVGGTILQALVKEVAAIPRRSLTDRQSPPPSGDTDSSILLG
jgi:hypothetical protein